MNNGEVYIRSISIFYNRLYFVNHYQVFGNSNSNVTHSTFSKSTTTYDHGNQTDYYESNSCELKILLCNYYQNGCFKFIHTTHNLYIINCSFDKNNIKVTYFYEESNIIHVKGCYFDTSVTDTIGNVTILEKAITINSENYHLSSTLCDAQIMLDFQICKRKESSQN